MRSAAYAEKKKTNFLKGKIRVFDKVQCDGFFKINDLPPASVLASYSKNHDKLNWKYQSTILVE